MFKNFLKNIFGTLLEYCKLSFKNELEHKILNRLAFLFMFKKTHFTSYSNNRLMSIP